MNIAIPVLDRCTKQALFRALRTVKMTFTARMVLEFLFDDETAHAWSLRRFAFAVDRQPRTVDAAIAELKRLGFLTVHYRRRGTAIKVIDVDAILQATNRAVAIAKASAKAAISLFRRTVQASLKSATSIHLDINRGAEDAKWRVQEAPTASLLRSLGMRVSPKRR